MILRVVSITKEESFKIREKFPNVYIVIVNRRGSAKKKNRFVEESHKVMLYLSKIRKQAKIKEYRYGE